MNKDILSFYNNKKILITGGRGYLGSNLANMLSHVACKIVRLGRSDVYQSVKESKADLIDIKADIRDKNTWIDLLEGIDFVFHFAAQTSVYKAEEDAVEDFKSNVLPMLHLIEVCKQNRWQPNTLFAGTVTEAGIPTAIPVDESHSDKPATLYDFHKLMAEKYLLYFANQAVMKGSVLRLANVYGPGPKSSNADRGILNLMIRKALRGEHLTLYGNGEHFRDYIYVTDVIQAFLLAGKNIDAVNGRQFIIGTGEGHTLGEAFKLIAERVKKMTGKNANIISIEPPTSQPTIDKRNFIANSSCFKSITSWKPIHSLRGGIDKTIESFLS